MNRQQRRKLERQGRKAGASEWQPLTEIDQQQLHVVGNLAGAAKALGIDDGEFRACASEFYGACRFFTNDTYEVTVRDADDPGWLHLAIRRRDGGVVGSW